jgi:hypothetical protein
VREEEGNDAARAVDYANSAAAAHAADDAAVQLVLNESDCSGWKRC